MNPLICAAIRDAKLLQFTYNGLHRIVAPYCHGLTANGEVLRAIQLGGDSHSQGIGFGKLWLLSKMHDVRGTDTSFVPDDPQYNPDDRALAEIHCRVMR